MGKGAGLECFWRVAPSGQNDRPVLVVVHCSDRDVETCMNGFVDLSIKFDLHLFAPIFPEVPGDQEATDSYKFLVGAGHDHVLEMNSALEEYCNLNKSSQTQFLMFGFSGGAQFAHRYAYVCPFGLIGLIVAAPGSVTLPTGAMTWWPGLDKMEAMIGHTLAQDAMAETKVSVLVGEDDLSGDLIDRPAGTPYGHPDFSRAGDTRVERAIRLHEAYLEVGIQSTCHILPGVSHDLKPILRYAERIFAGWLSETPRYC